VNYAAIVLRISCETMGWLRAGVGVALVAAPGTAMRLGGRPGASGAELLLLRTIGIRDLVLGAGTVVAARSGDAGGAGRWIAAGLASDSLDAVVSLASRRDIGTREALGAAVLALTFAGGDVLARRQLTAQAG
jgi:hypothetical protein